MKLYYSPTSPYVRKVNVCAFELGLDKEIELISTNPWEADPRLLINNPLSKVPTLITDDGMELYDSPVICEYLDSINGQSVLIPAKGSERWQALKLEALGDGILDAAVLRFLERKRPTVQQSKDWDTMQKDSILRSLQYLENNISMWPADLTIGQIAVACALGYLDFRFADEDWRQLQPVLANWYKGFVERGSMQATLPKASG
jgi:glutathione S-transferase